MSRSPEALQRLIQSERARWQRLQLLEGAGAAVSGVVAYFLGAVLLDNYARLPVAGRWLAAAGLVAACAWFARLLVRRWRLRRASEDEIALAMERRTPGGVQNRLINALQIGREGNAPAAMATALVQENWRQLEERPPAEAAPALPAAGFVLLAACLTAIAAAGWLWQPARFSTAASRILMPFAAIHPVYRTVLIVEPGDIEAEGDITIQVTIQGERLREIEVLVEEQDRRATYVVPVTQGSSEATYTLPNVRRSLTYAVRGGDFCSPYYRIEVPTPARVARVRATFHYPGYTGLPDRTVETAGDLEAVQGTRADLVVVLDNPADAAALILRTSGGEDDSDRRIELVRESPTEFSGQAAFDDSAEYQVATRQGDHAPRPTAWHTLRAIADEPPKPELTGVPPSGEAPLDSPLPLGISATDDFGLTQYGIFVRRAVAGTADENAAADWTPIARWDSTRETKAAQSAELLALDAGAAEGDRLEVVARAMDGHPDRAGQWVEGQVQTLLVAGEGAQLQLLYEQILRSEAELAALAGAEQSLHEKADTLIRRLDAEPPPDGAADMRVQEVLAWATEQSREQEQVRETAARAARDMPTVAGSLRLSLGMLADTEMIRGIRVLESVATRNDDAGRRAALAEARATQQRIWQGLEQMLEQYVHFRQEWELAHMTPFLRMLADRQVTLRDESRRRAEAAGDVSSVRREACARRQAKLAELCGLAAAAFAGLAERTEEIESELAAAFADTADALDGESLTGPMAAAGEALSTGDWGLAAAEQARAAELLEQILTRLQEAQAEAARRVLAGLADRAESDLAAQAELEQLQAGDEEDLLDEPAGLELTDIVHMAEVAQAQQQAGQEPEPYVNDYLLPDSAVPGLQQPDKGIRQEFDILRLATSPGKTPSFPQQSDRQGNRVKPHIQEEFEDLVGDLLEEADEMQANYETYNLNAAFNINEPGEIGKQGGDLNSTAAAAATGNQKPPTTNVGGASRVGRQGARAHGAAVGDESINRRGRDRVQEGQERSPDQAGSVQETLSDDPQEDTSTGIGGRRVESEETHFSLNDAGEWTDDMADRMDKPQETQFIVERQGDPLDARVAEMMRDMNSTQEQLIERLKSIRKELKNLYLPTDHLDQLIDQMQANLHSLGERPSAEVFRLQQETLDQVAAALDVFHQAHAGFQASLPREQSVRGRVLDDPTRATPPGYEEAVQDYYRRLIEHP